jgi:Spy/CpxP family protein refolding chaperone
MSWFRGATLALMLVTALAAAPAVSAYGEEMGQPKQNKLLQELNLTPQQKQRVKELRLKMRPKVQSHKQALTKAKQELADLQAANAPADKIQAKKKQIQSLQQATATMRKQYTAALKEILTPEQWTKLQKLKKEKRDNRGSED